MFRNYNFKRYDFSIVLILIILVSIGIVAIGSATHINSETGTDYFRNKQLIGFIIGIVIMISVSLIDYQFIGKFYWIIYIFNIILLLAVLFLGTASKGATRWIQLGPFNLQPSEFSKIFMTIFIAKFIDKHKERINQPIFILQLFILVGIPMVLIKEQPDLSTSLVLIFLLVVELFVAGINYKYVVGVISVAVPSILFILWYIQLPGQKLLQGYQVDRILALLYPERYALSEALQTNNSIQAIGSGQLFGKGLYNGTLNKYNYLPEPQTDFIFSIIGEEAGFFGCSIVLLLITILIIKCLWIAKDTTNLYSTLIVTGVVAIIVFQTFVNVGVATGIAPNTGIPLPFISYGLSSLMSNMIAMGMILNISMQRKTNYY